MLAALARARRVRRVGPAPRRRAAVGVLRGAADRQRQPRHPPRAEPGVQGHLPPLPDDDRALRRAQGRAGTATGCRWSWRSRPSWAFTSKDDIERFGIAEFNARCREKVLSHVAEWNRLTERIGFWVDLDDAYRTLDPGYIESVWWALKTIHEKGLLYEKLKVVPYCPRDQTTLSSHELGQPGAYRDVVDPSVYVRLPVTRPAGPARHGDELLVWTTTPWTLVSNAAVAVNPELTYVRARAPATADRVQIVAQALVDKVLGRGARGAGAFPGAELVGTALRGAVRLHPRRGLRPQGPHRAARRLRHRRLTAPGSCTPRSRSARTTSGSASRRA